MKLDEYSKTTADGACGAVSIEHEESVRKIKELEEAEHYPYHLCPGGGL